MRAVVADEWSVLRGGVAVVLGECDVRIAAQVGSATEAIGLLAKTNADIFVVGLVSDLSVSVAIGQARTRQPTVRSVALLAEPTRGVLTECLDNGADAVLARSGSDYELRDAIKRVSVGERYVASALLTTLFGQQAATDRGPAANLLTERERRVLGLLVEGRTNLQIARQLFIEPSTVKTHLRNLYGKLGASNRFEAVSRAVEQRLLY